MKTRILHTQFWKDGFVRRLKSNEKLVYAYLLTNDKVNIIFCFELTIDEIAFDLGLTKKQVTSSLKKLSENKKISCYKDWIFLLNANKYETYSGSKNEIAKQKIVEKMSKDVLDWLNNPLDRGIYRGTMIPPINHNTEIISKKTEVISKEIKIEKEDNKEFIESLTDEFCTKVAKNYGTTLQVVLRKKNDLILYCRSHGKKYKDYRATLQAWVRKDQNV